jgi:hypothetical protein
VHVWLQLEFPWLAYGFVSAVSEDYADEFERALAELDFVVASVHSPSREEMFRGILESLRLPEWCDFPKWDSLIDCLRDFEWPQRFALVLREADTFAAADPKSFGEACAVLQLAFDEHGSERQQSVLVITGRGVSFHDPGHPAPDRALDEEHNTPVAVERRRRMRQNP